ncbi:MAG: ABC transporter ATP-binding protein [Chlorobiota bacterium]
MIQFQDIYKSFGKLDVLKGVTTEVSGGGISAILGPNGSGKTTLIKMLLGMVYPNNGEIIFDGKPIKKEWNYKKDISYLPQIARFPENLTINNLIELIKDIRGGNSEEKKLIELFDLKSHLDKKIKHLSGGTKQKVNITLAMMYDNPVIVLDEPSTGLDPIALVRLKNLILEERKKGKNILITTHIMSLVEDLSDEILYLLEGKIHFRGTIPEIKEFTGAINLETAIANLLEQKNAENIKV